MTDDFLNAATAPGDLPYAAIRQRIASQATQWRHDNELRPMGPGPEDAVEVFATAGSRIRVAHPGVRYTTDGSEPDGWAACVPMERVDVAFEPLAGYINRWRGVLPPQPVGTVVRYQVIDDLESPTPRPAQDGQGFWFRYSPEQSVTTFAYRVETPGAPHPVWLQDAVIYHIFLDRFHPGPGARFADGADPLAVHGGTFGGVREALPYLEALGITCLWLSPVGPAPSYHRYDATNFFTVDPALGTENDLKQLVAEAHRRGMRVLLDFVPSHMSSAHPAFAAAVSDVDAASRSWFVFYEWPDRYRSFLEAVPWLPSVNTNDPGLRRHLVESALHWVRAYGIDGFRLDHAIGHGMDFWTEFRAALAAENAEVVTIGEVTDTPDALRRFRGRLHDVLDFPLAGALRQTFGAREWGVDAFESFLDAYESYMDEGPGRVSFLDNHDMDRFSFVAGNDAGRLKQALLCQFSLRPPPVVYYGSEIDLRQTAGMADSPTGDAEVRQDMVWERSTWNVELLSFYTAAIRLRRSEPSLRYGARHLLHLDGASGTYAYLRSARGNESPQPGVVVAAFNLGTNARWIALPPADYRLLLGTGPGIRVEQDGILLPPDNAAWLAVGP